MSSKDVPRIPLPVPGLPHVTSQHLANGSGHADR
jgi:hypothetical protein